MLANNEGDLLPRLRAGDEDAFTLLVTRYHRGLLAVARGLLPGSEAEEVVQEAWLNAYRHLATFEGRSSLRTWLTRIVINQARMRLRGGGRHLLESLDDEDALATRFAADGHWQTPPVEWGYPSPAALLEERELADCLSHTLAQLPPNQRLVVELRDLQGEALESICNLLDLTASNVRVLLHRARARLFLHVERYRETGEC